MKRGNLLNSEISSVISTMGHTDQLTLGDAGLPIPESVYRIDLAVSHGIPSLVQVLKPVLDELCVEKVILAEEIRNENPECLEEILTMFAEYEKSSGYKPAMSFVSHADFKAQTEKSKAVIRTGEVQPYANIILESGVTF